MPLNAPRDTIERGRDLLVLRVAAGAKIHAGALVALNAAGFAVPGALSATLKAAGRAEASIDNTGGADGAVSVTVKRGAFRFSNHGADAVDQSSILDDCYIVDDATVAKTHAADSRSRAGKVLDVDVTGVWVEIV